MNFSEVRSSIQLSYRRAQNKSGDNSSRVEPGRVSKNGPRKRELLKLAQSKRFAWHAAEGDAARASVCTAGACSRFGNSARSRRSCRNPPSGCGQAERQLAGAFPPKSKSGRLAFVDNSSNKSPRGASSCRSGDRRSGCPVPGHGGGIQMRPPKTIKKL